MNQVILIRELGMQKRKLNRLELDFSGLSQSSLNSNSDGLFESFQNGFNNLSELNALSINLKN